MPPPSAVGVPHTTSRLDLEIVMSYAEDSTVASHQAPSGGTRWLRFAALPIVVHFGPLNLIGYAVPILMMVSGLMLWSAPHPRMFYAVLILLLALGSWITSNLGGFILGMLLGLGAMSATWSAQRRGHGVTSTASEAG
jgi:hypothetical protein